jgi:hypothetical protein
MSLIEDPLTVLTDAHRRVVRWLENRGWNLLEEVDFPPYRADIFLPDLHAIIEIDGPQHSAKENAKRDEYIWETYSAPTFRVAHDTNPREWSPSFLKFVSDYADDAEERWDACRIRTPWL